jgi:hypothetical protein
MEGDVHLLWCHPTGPLPLDGLCQRRPMGDGTRSRQGLLGARLLGGVSEAAQAGSFRAPLG